MSPPPRLEHDPRPAPGPSATEHRARGLILAALLAGLAGLVDGIGFMRLGHLFVSYMSGNTTQMALAAGRLRLDEAGSILALIGLFVAGAAGGQILAHLTGRRHLTAVLAVVIALLAASAALGTAPKPLVLAMGALNAAMHRAGNVRVNLTFVTGTLVRFGQGLGDLLVGRPLGWVWIEQAVPWLGMVGGAALAGALYLRIGSAVDWVPVGLAGALLLWSATIPEPPQ
ncbi:MAG: YoaK family protein [Stellaceae bacterium]